MKPLGSHWKLNEMNPFILNLEGHTGVHRPTNVTFGTEIAIPIQNMALDYYVLLPRHTS